MSKKIEIPKRQYISLVWNILEKYFSLNPSERGKFARSNGVIGAFCKRLSLDIYLHVTNTYLENESNYDDVRFNNIRRYIYKMPSIVTNWDKRHDNSEANNYSEESEEKYEKIIKKLIASEKAFESAKANLKIEFANLEQEKKDLSKGKDTDFEAISEIDTKITLLKKKQMNLKSSRTIDKGIFIIGLNKKLLEPALIPTNFDGESKSTSLTLPQLDSLALYAFDKNFSDFLNQESNYLISDGSINLIHTEIAEEYLEPITKVIEAFQSATKMGGSKSLRELHIKEFTSKTQSILNEIKNGTVIRTLEEYMIKLCDYIASCSVGLGVNIPDWDKNFNTEIGKKILKVNLNQANKKYDHFTERHYVRIFFLESKNPNKINKKDKLLLSEQLNHKVEVLVILLRELDKYFIKKGETHEIKDLDFALLRVNDSPVVADSFVNKSESENGTFHIDRQEASKYYNRYLKDLFADDALNKYRIDENSDGSKLIKINFRDVNYYQTLIEKIIRI
jgi:hypothetical protein